MSSNPDVWGKDGTGTLSVVRGRDLSSLLVLLELVFGADAGLYVELQMFRLVLHNLSTFKLRAYQLLSHRNVEKRSSIFV